MLFRCQSKKQKRTIKQRISAVLISAELLSLLGFMTGCGGSKAAIPQLEEPIVAEASYRPLSKRIVGKKEIMYGKVVPREYPCFAKEGVDLKELNVGIGDYVEEGDVIAVGSSGPYSELIIGLENEIKSLNRQRTNTINISNKTLEKLDYEKKIEQYLEDDAAIQEKDKAIASENENQRFSVALIDSDISSKKKQLDELYNKTASKVFKAPCSGYVSFVKDISQSNHVEANENIAVIYDPEELYIESDEYTIDNYKYEDYKCKWALINGKRTPITERKYTNEEVSYAKSVKCNPYIQFEAPEEKLTMGVDVVLFFMDSDDTEKLAVGNDSIYRENDSTFVYIKSATGTDADEKREVKLGVTDGHYTEVISGIEEGEQIFYRNSEAIPKRRDMGDAVSGDFQEKCETEFVSILNPYSKIYMSEYSGKLLEMHDLGTASAGDSLYVLQTNIGSAELEDVRKEIELLDINREKERKEYEKTTSELETVLNNAKTMNTEEMATDSDAIHETMYLAERTQCELDILNYNESYAKEQYAADRTVAEKQLSNFSNARKDGTSDYTLNSEVDGSINSLGVTRNTRLEKNQYIMTEQYSKEDDGSTRLHVLVDSKDPSMPNANPKIGEEVIFYNETKSWTGKCLGINGNPERYMLFTRDEQQHATYSSPYFKGIEYQFDFVVDDKITKEDMEKSKVKFFGKDFRQVVIVPSTSVKTEYDNLAQQEYNYVWKVENGEIVKEYVTIHKTPVATGTTYILDGVEVGDKVLK